MIIVARNAGFCFGVRRATDTVEELIKNKEENHIVCTLGKLIHNEEYNNYLKENGVLELDPDGLVKIIAESEADTRITAVIRTHGITKDIQEKLQTSTEGAKSVTLIDCTCPYVKKIHKLANESTLAPSELIVIGQREHPEVRSIISYTHGMGTVFSDAA